MNNNHRRVFKPAIQAVMSHIPYTLFSTFKILGVASNVTEFEQWYLETYKRLPGTELLHGYKYFIEGCFHLLYDAIDRDSFAGIKNDLLLNMAIAQWISFEKLDNTCTKTILLKNIYKYIRPVKKTKSFPELEEKLKQFNQEVTVPFEKLLQSRASIKVEHRLSKERIIEISCISTLYLYFNQITNNSPVAHISFLAGLISRDRKKIDVVFEGYKYVLQFVWIKIIGKKKYSATSLIHLQEADSWGKYIYNKTDNKKVKDFDIFFQTHNLEKQTCLDSYFERIKTEIIRPLERKYRINIIELNDYWDFSSPAADKKYFKKLLTRSELENPFSRLSVEDKIRTILYWLPIEVINSGNSSSYSGVSAFNTMLAGTVALLKKESEYKKCIACKFKHPRDSDTNTYSYGILIDSKAAADNYHSGWIIYYDCCNDYSGFSGSEYKAAEQLINQYKLQNKLELRELEVDDKSFSDFIACYLHKDAEVSVEEYNDTKNKLQEISIRNQKIWKDIKAFLLEWAAYYVYVNQFSSKDVKWSIEKKIGEIDVFIEADKFIKLVECKINPANCDLQKECRKLIKKAKLKSEQLDKPYHIEFWFWLPPSSQNQKVLKENDAKYIVLSEKKKSVLLAHLNLSRIKSIMGIHFYE